MGAIVRGALLWSVLALTASSADEGEMKETAVDKALIVSPQVRDIIQQGKDVQIYKDMALAATGYTAVAAGGGCAVGAFIGSLLPGLGTAVGCAGGAFFAGIFRLAFDISSLWSEQMRRAVFAWKVYRRSLKHLKMVPGHDVRRKFRGCAKEVHEDLWPKGIDVEEANMMKELFAECTFAAQYINKFTETYGIVKLGDQLAFYTTFAGKWANFFKGPSKAMTDDEITEYMAKNKDPKDEL